MKVALYIRVSTEDQAKEGYPHSFACAKLNMGTSSLEVQRDRLESFAIREGLEIFKTYQDDGISGYTTERHALKELLKDAKEKRLDL